MTYVWRDKPHGLVPRRWPTTCTVSTSAYPQSLGSVSHYYQRQTTTSTTARALLSSTTSTAAVSKMATAKALCEQVLTRVTSTRILGVIIDDRLTWSPHIDFVIRKTCAKVGALRRSFRQLSRKARRQFIVSVILPDLLYCCSCFVTKLSAKDRQRLSTVFRRAVRAACGAKSQDDIMPLLTTLSIYPFEHY
eukprot:scpid90345/ scgid14714/ 